MVRIHRNLLYGSALMIAMRWTTRLLGLFSTLILVRLLNPDDFGVVAMAMVIVGLLEVFTHTSVDLALIRDRDPSREHYDTAWTLEIVQALALAGVLVLVAPWSARYFEDARVTLVIYALALRAVLGSFENIGVVAFRRDLEFEKEFWFGVSKKMAMVGLTIIAAFTLQSYWALVFGLVVGRCADVVISFRLHPYRPRFCLRKTAELWGFSKWLLAGRVGDMIKRKLDELVIGGELGTTAMGNYFVAADVATAPTEEIVGPMSRGIYPVYSQLLDTRSQLIDSFLLVLSSTTYLCMPLGMGLSAIAPNLVPLVLGEKWLAAIQLIEYLGICGIAMALVMTVEPLLVATGRARLFASFQWLQLLILAPALIYAGKMLGVVGVAAAKTVILTLSLPIWFYVVSRAELISARRMLAAVLPALLAGIAMYAGVRAVGQIPMPSEVLILISQLIMGAGIYLAVSWSIWRARGCPDGAERQALDRVRDLWQQWRRKPG
jgi:O-antigen/teichoic acid export membrane protein